MDNKQLEKRIKKLEQHNIMVKKALDEYTNRENKIINQIIKQINQNSSLIKVISSVVHTVTNSFKLLDGKTLKDLKKYAPNEYKEICKSTKKYIKSKKKK